ncbi:MAG: hypothetical protein AABW81_00495 [Nanoarchaeota archaeon]
MGKKSLALITTLLVGALFSDILKAGEIKNSNIAQDALLFMKSCLIKKILIY